MGLLRTLIGPKGSSSPVRSPRLSSSTPGSTSSTIGPPPSKDASSSSTSLVEEKALIVDKVAGRGGREGPESPGLDRARTIRQADFRSPVIPSPSSPPPPPPLAPPIPLEATLPPLPSLLPVAPGQGNATSLIISPISPLSTSSMSPPRSSTSSDERHPPPYSHPPAAGPIPTTASRSRMSRSSHSSLEHANGELAQGNNRKQEQMRIVSEKRARRRSSDGVEGVVGVGVGVNGAGGLNIRGLRGGSAEEEQTLGEVKAMIQYQTTQTTTITTTTTTTTQIYPFVSNPSFPTPPPPINYPAESSIQNTPMPTRKAVLRHESSDSSIPSPTPTALSKTTLPTLGSSPETSFHTAQSSPSPNPSDDFGSAYTHRRVSTGGSSASSAVNGVSSRSSKRLTMIYSGKGSLESLANLPPLPVEKSLPPLPAEAYQDPVKPRNASFSVNRPGEGNGTEGKSALQGFRSLSQPLLKSSMPMPDGIVVTPSSPGSSPGPTSLLGSGSPQEAASPSETETEDEEGGLDRRRTIKPDDALWVRARKASDLSKKDSKEGLVQRKLRHVRSLGIGTPPDPETSRGRGQAGAKAGMTRDAGSVEMLAGTPSDTRSTSTASLGSTLSAPGQDATLPPRSRSPSPIAAAFDKLRGVSQPLPDESSRRRSGQDGRPDDVAAGRSASATRSRPTVRKVKSFSSFFGGGNAVETSLREAMQEQVPPLPAMYANQKPGSRQASSTLLAAAGEGSRDPTPPASSSDHSSEQAHQGETVKRRRGPSGWFGLRKPSSKDVSPASSTRPSSDRPPTASPDIFLDDDPPLATPPLSSPMAIPRRSDDNPPARMSWLKGLNIQQSPLMDPASMFGQGSASSLQQSPLSEGPPFAISPRTSSLGYFPSAGESSPSRRSSVGLSPGFGPGRMIRTASDIAPSSTASSLRSEVPMEADEEPSTAGLQGLGYSSLRDVRPLDSNMLSSSTSGPGVFKRPHTPERVRARSDTPEYVTRSQSLENNNFDQDFGRLFAGGRPPMGERSNSASSLAFERVKGIVTLGGRSRSSSLLRRNSLLGSPRKGPSSPNPPRSPSTSSLSLASGFSARADRAESPMEMEPGSAPSSRRSSILWRQGRSRASSAADSTVLPVLDERPIQSARERQPTIAFTSPEGSLQGSELGGTGPTEELMSTKPRKSRPRASTLFTTRPASPSPSPSKLGGGLHPKAARRMSTTFFRGFGEGSGSSRPASPSGLSPNHTPVLAPRPAPVLPDKLDDDEPAQWLERLLEVVEKSEVPNILAAKNDPFYAATLEVFMHRFDFEHDPLDIALRKLLMLASLPKETQQIDRVMEAFAKRYNSCHPGLFLDPDHAYVIAFSMIMLHTDAFNKHNKRKMTKADYTKNTRLPGVNPLVLETFFDNTCYTAFRYIEDVENPNSLISERQGRDRSASAISVGASSRAPRIDVYRILSGGGGSFRSLHVDVMRHMPESDPISYQGSRPFFDFGAVREVFRTAPSIEAVKARPRRKSGATMLASAGGAATPGAVDREETVLTLRIVKLGLLSRKDDLGEGSTKAGNRKWRSWSVLLTGTQLIFLKEPTLALSLLEQMNAPAALGPGPSMPRLNDFKPDEVMGLGGVTAVHDSSYDKYPNAFRLMLPQGRQYILQASDEFEMNEWIAAINWGAAYKTSGIAMPFLVPKKDTSSSAISPGLSPMPVAALSPSLVSPLVAPGDLPPQEDKDGETLAESMKSEGLDSATIEAALQLHQSERRTQEEVAKAAVANVGSRSPVKEPGSPSGMLPRAEAITIKIAEYRNRFVPLQKQVEDELRIARSLDLLTPFEKSTRDKIEGQVPLMAAKLHRLRLQLACYRCWIGILEGDLASGGGVEDGSVAVRPSGEQQV